MNLRSVFKHVPALTQRERLQLLHQPIRIVLRTVLCDVTERPARSIEFSSSRQGLSKPEALLLWASKAFDAKGLNPNRVPSDFTAEIEFSAALSVERLNLKGLADGSCKGPLGGARHPTDRVRHAHNAHPVPDPDVAARDVS